MFVCVYRFEYHMLPAPYMVFSLVGAQIYINRNCSCDALFFRGKQNPEEVRRADEVGGELRMGRTNKAERRV